MLLGRIPRLTRVCVGYANFCLLFVLINGTHASVALFGMGATQNFLSGWARPRRRSDPVARAKIEDLRVRIKRVKCSPLFSGNCLSQSLVLQFLASLAGIQTVIVLGVLRDGEEFLAHAWVTHNGQPVNLGPKMEALYAEFGAV